jgi:hypothetical protein
MFNQSSIFQYRLEDEAIDLRKQAEDMPDGVRRDELLRMASHIDNALTVNKWLNSPGLRAPK